MRVGKDRVVTLRHRVTTPDGAVLDEGAEPIRYLHGGYGDIFDKLEQALDGKEVGDCIQVPLSPAEAFGEYDQSLVAVEAADSFETAPQKGDQFERQVDGESRLYRVIEIADGKVVVDANHPLAGLDLVFAATIIHIRAASDAEIAAKAPPGAAPPQPLSEERMRLSGPVSMVLRFSIYSAAHKLFWQAPLFLLPALAALLYWLGQENACWGLTALWLAWAFLAAWLTGKAIRRWGYRFWFFDFSPNTQPSPLERRIATLGQAVPVVLGLLAVIVAVALDGFHDLLAKLGVGLAVAFVLIIPGGFILPFLVMVLSGFRVRPVIDGE